MTTRVSAVYENGVLRLLTPLALPEHTPVEVTVEVLSDGVPEDPRGRIRAALIAAGLSQEHPAPRRGPQPLAVEERAALAQQVVKGRPLSEIIDEEREGR